MNSPPYYQQLCCCCVSSLLLPAIVLLLPLPKTTPATATIAPLLPRRALLPGASLIHKDGAAHEVTLVKATHSCSSNIQQQQRQQRQQEDSIAAVTAVPAQSVKYEVTGVCEGAAPPWHEPRAQNCAALEVTFVKAAHSLQSEPGKPRHFPHADSNRVSSMPITSVSVASDHSLACDCDCAVACMGSQACWVASASTTLHTCTANNHARFLHQPTAEV
jgi:hypothetical protein